MNTLKKLRIQPIWVNPQHLVSTAAHILAGHRVRALGVVEDGVLIGTIGGEEVLLAAEGQTVGQVMRPLASVVQLSSTIRAVAELLVENDLSYVPVVDEGAFVGIVTPNMLLKEMGRSFDPLTGLSWSDHLRQWGLHHLESGDEVTIIFIDLNDFGQYNKRHGHIIGDRVIRMVAESLRDCIDPSRDILVRYGGDEFAIGTLRYREEAELLMELIKRNANGIAVEDGIEPVTFSIGVFGGRRTKEREDTHFAATLDNLINIASRSAMAAKVAARRVPRAGVTIEGPSDPPEDRYRVVGVYADDQGLRPVTTVILGLKDTVVSGAAPQMGLSSLEAAAHATAKAVERTKPEMGLKVETLTVEGGYVQLTGRVSRGDSSKPVTIRKQVGDDPLLAVAEATVQALTES